MNKMYFYCFLPSLSTNYTNYTNYSCRSCHSMITSSPIQELEPGATPCRGGRCAARYPHGPQQPANKNT